MLVLQRKRDEKVYIVIPPSDCSTRIEVTVADLNKNYCKLGFGAPRTVEILRDNAIDRIKPHTGEHNGKHVVRP